MRGMGGEGLAVGLLVGFVVGMLALTVIVSGGLSTKYLAKSDIYEQRWFPCREDEVLGFAPRFGSDKTGCIQVDSLVRTLVVGDSSLRLHEWCGPMAAACLTYAPLHEQYVVRRPDAPCSVLACARASADFMGPVFPIKLPRCRIC